MTLKAGDILRAGDRIATASNQEVQVVSEIGDRVLLREEGKIEVGGRRSEDSARRSEAFFLGKGAIVAQVKRPTSFATPHAAMETDGADFFLMVANGLTTNGGPWSFSRVDVTEGSANFLPFSISNLKSEIPLVARQAVCAGTDMEGQTIAVKAGKSDCRELSPKYGGVFFREYAELYETKDAALDVLRFTEGRVLLETNAWQMMDKLTSQGGPKIAKDTRRRTGEPALRIANGTADVARVSFPLGWVPSSRRHDRRTFCLRNEFRSVRLVVRQRSGKVGSYGSCGTDGNGDRRDTDPGVAVCAREHRCGWSARFVEYGVSLRWRSKWQVRRNEEEATV